MQSVCWFGVINQWPPVLFEQFWNCPFFILAISKFSKMHSGNLSQIAFLNMWLLIQINRIRTCDMKWTTLKVHTDEMMKLDSDEWICDNWLRRGGTIYSYFTKVNNWKLFHPCDVISYNVTNFFNYTSKWKEYYNCSYAKNLWLYPDRIYDSKNSLQQHILCTSFMEILTKLLDLTL